MESLPSSGVRKCALAGCTWSTWRGAGRPRQLGQLGLHSEQAQPSTPHLLLRCVCGRWNAFVHEASSACRDLVPRTSDISTCSRRQVVEIGTHSCM